MGKYEDLIFKGLYCDCEINKQNLEWAGKQADAEIAELEKQMKKIKTERDQLLFVAVNHNALVERVKAHNDKISDPKP